MRSKWGNVAPGKLLTGIVAALNMQEVQLATLLEALTVNEDTPIFNNTKKPKNIYGNVNNVWAATTAGNMNNFINNLYTEKMNRMKALLSYIALIYLNIVRKKKTTIFHTRV